MRAGDYAFIRLHRGYDNPSTRLLGRKISQQYAEPFRILERIGRRAYRLELPTHWRIHCVLSVAQSSVAQLEPTPPHQLDMKIKQAYISSTGVSIPLDVRSAKISVQRPVHLRKTIVIPPHVELAIPVHHAGFPDTRDFLFEPDDNIALLMYAHLVDASTKRS